ncbi:hypothetical protein AADG42_13940 [Ammonicoccus fulvus]|uniref:Uncharacterized protein n=1 Tax=Ammonicoccus fulvus TaxID=3138240 RepID=A0ABZ3FRK7_9ACTN
MADPLRSRSTPGRVLVALLGVVALMGCAPGPATPPTLPSATAGPGVPSSPSPPNHADLTRLLDRLAATDDEPGWRALIDSVDPHFATTSLWLRDNLAGLDLRLEPGSRIRALTAQRQELLGTEAFVQEVRARWSVPGTAPAEHTLWLTLTPGARGLRLAGITDGPCPTDAGSGPLPIWWLESVRIIRQGEVAVLAARSQDPDAWLPGLVQAREAVARRVPTTEPLVAQLPSTAGGFERVLGVRQGSHRLVAAAAWPFGDAAQLVVNPEAGGATQGEARQVLLTHEAVHVAAGSVRGQGPLWLTEGYADLVALADHPAVAAAHEANLADDQRRHGIADALVTNAELRPDNARVHAHYQRAWITVRVLDHGPDSRPAPGGGVADRVHAAVLTGTPLDDALAAEGWSTGTLTEAVSAELRRLVG